MSAWFALVSASPNGICAILEKLNFPVRSSADAQVLNSSLSAIRFPAFAAEDHSIASASPLDVAVVACLWDLRSTRYVLPLRQANTINLPPSLRGEAKLEVAEDEVCSSSQTSMPHVMNVKLYVALCVPRNPACV